MSDDNQRAVAPQARAKQFIRSRLMGGAAAVLLGAAPSLIAPHAAGAMLADERTLEQRLDNIQSSLGACGSLGQVGVSEQEQRGTQLSWGDWSRWSDWVDWGNMKP